MLKNRIIRPGIVTNEVLASLGVEATLLFERLWMLADREGRLEDRPARIRAEAFPYWPDFPVEKLVEKLCESGFILRYKPRETPENPLILIVNFCKHQHIHPHEAQSTLPPPPRTGGRPRTSGADGRRDIPGHVETCNDIPGNVRVPLPLPIPNSGGAHTTCGIPAVENSPPPPPKSTRTQQRKPPARAAAGDETGPRESPPKSRASPEELNLLRESLDHLAREIRMSPPDDEMVQRIFDSGRGASAMEIHEALAMLYRRNKFREMRSWGFIPVILADCFGRQRTLQVYA
jgi:hypothetical protein